MAGMSEIPPKLKASLESTKVEYRYLGNTGLRVSVPIFGCMSFGDPNVRLLEWAIGEEEYITDKPAQALPLLKSAYDKGVNTWDTANIYSNGESERIIGKALKKYDIPRGKVVIMTKCYSAVAEEPGAVLWMVRDKMEASKDYQNMYGLSRAAIFNQVEASLKRLDVDYIDVLQIHRFDKITPIEETMRALHDLVTMGKVRYIGASSMWATEFARMQHCAEMKGWTKFVSMQNFYNLLYREEEREMNRFCNETGVGLIPWSPLAAGALARPPGQFGSTKRGAMQVSRLPGGPGEGEPDLTILKRVQEIAEKKGWRMNVVALAWINKRVASPIVGFRNMDALDQALEATGKVLTDEEEKYLEELYQPKEIRGHS